MPLLFTSMAYFPCLMVTGLSCENKINWVAACNAPPPARHLLLLENSLVLTAVTIAPGFCCFVFWYKYLPNSHAHNPHINFDNNRRKLRTENMKRYFSLVRKNTILPWSPIHQLEIDVRKGVSFAATFRRSDFQSKSISVFVWRFCSWVEYSYIPASITKLCSVKWLIIIGKCLFFYYVQNIDLLIYCYSVW